MGEQSYTTGSGLERHGTFFRFFSADKPAYEKGVESTSYMPVIYIDPNKFTLGQPGAQEVRKQLEEQMPGSSARFNDKDLQDIANAALLSGPFATNALIKDRDGGDVCLVNKPNGTIINPDHALESFGIAGPGAMDRRHLKDLPGSVEEWQYRVGKHEGEHCNQLETDTVTPEGKCRYLENETRSDRQAIRTLREEGKNDIAQALIDVRAIAAANGDADHATGIFIDDADSPTITPEITAAAREFKDVMVAEVAKRQGLSVAEAEKLRHADPRAFTATVDEAMKDGAFDQKGPYTKRYIQAYSGAVDRLCVEDTTPFPPEPVAPAPEEPESSEEPAAAESQVTPDPAPESPDDDMPPTVSGEEAAAIYQDLMSRVTVAQIGTSDPAPAPAAPAPAQTKPEYAATI